MNKWHTILVVLAAITLPTLPGCSDGDAPASRPPSPASLEPADAALAAIYNRSCRSCHAQGTAAAPLTGDTAAWEPRMAKGMDVMLDHAINGFGGMPPMGMCFDCSEADFVALIQFMASGR